MSELDFLYLVLDVVALLPAPAPPPPAPIPIRLQILELALFLASPPLAKLKFSPPVLPEIAELFNPLLEIPEFDPIKQTPP